MQKLKKIQFEYPTETDSVHIAANFTKDTSKKNFYIQVQLRRLRGLQQKICTNYSSLAAFL
jgi:hypothetical protein